MSLVTMVVAVRTRASYMTPLSRLRVSTPTAAAASRRDRSPSGGTCCGIIDGMKLLPCLLIAVGGFASIATSRPSGWSMSANGNLPPLVLDGQTSVARYLIHTELHGPEPFDGLDGTLEVNVVVRARVMSSASATIEVHSLTHPDEAPTTMTTGVNDTFSHYLAIQSFLACTTDPCSEDYEVVVQCKPAAGLPQIDVSGNISSFVTGMPQQAPPGTAVGATVMAEP